MTPTGRRFDAIVIGAGEAGAVVASRAVRAGHRVAMIYQQPYGSTCLNTGCVPSKFLIQRAHVAHVARSAGRFHVEAGDPEVDLSAIVEEKDELVRTDREEARRRAVAAGHLTLMEGRARFMGPGTVAVKDEVLASERIFVATGMRPMKPPIEGLDAVPYLTSESLLDLRELPEHLIVVGGGYVACELGQAFRRFGSRVTMIQRPIHLCPHEEPDVSSLLERAFRDEGISLLLSHRAVRVGRAGRGVRVVAEPPDGPRRRIEGSHLLIATGRRPNTDGLGLKRVGIETRRDGSIPVDGRLRAADGIWAIGDVNGSQPFTRVCQEEAKVAYADAFEGADLEIDRFPLGHAIFTEPQIGSVGLTERAARNAGNDVAVGLVTFDQVEKAALIGETNGLIKYVVERGGRRLLGCHVIGPQAAELVYDAIVVLRHRGTLDELATAVGIFPTLQEGMEGTARGLLRRLAPAEAVRPLAAIPARRESKEARVP